jgi:hypothetical protein
VGPRLWAEGFRNAAQADSFRSSLLTAARKGEAFSLNTGRPVSWTRDESTISWYALTRRTGASSPALVAASSTTGHTC